MGNKICSKRSESDVLRSRVIHAQDSFVKDKVYQSKNVKKKEDDAVSMDSMESAGAKGGDQTDSANLQKKLVRAVSSGFDDIDYGRIEMDLSQFDFPFENLVFEGGGNKGLAYCGALKVLEELGVMKQVRRIAGTSAGAMTAALLAVGYTAEEIQDFLSQDLSKIFLDHSCGYLSLLPNLIRGYGWNPGKRIFKWFGDRLHDRIGDPDITFVQLYQKRKIELCIVVTNLNMMNAEYFHSKTTPNIPIRTAVRMSMAIPGMFQASRLEDYGQINTYVDGGVLCNYPINCFDGWWLSMDMKDSFLNKLQPLEDFPKLFEKKERFGKFNDKTLGFLLYSDTERDILRDALDKRVGSHSPQFPDTKLGKEKKKKKQEQERAREQHLKVSHAVNAFFKVLKKHNKDGDDKINRQELANAFNDNIEEEFPKRYIARLFGPDVTVDDAFKALDTDGSGEIKYNELMHFIERTGVSLQSKFLGYKRKEITNIFSFFDTLQSALLTNVKRVFVEEKDIERTVGINTGHVDTSDFVLEQEDRDYVIQQGRTATEAFLKYYVIKHHLPEREGMTADGAEEDEADPFNDSGESNISDSKILLLEGSKKA